MIKKRFGIAAIVCLTVCSILLSSGAAAVDKGSSRRLNSREDEGGIMPWNECVIVTATAPGDEDEFVCGIMPGSKYTPITNYNDRAQVEKFICFYVSSKSRELKKERPEEFTYTIKFPKGMETPAWANESVLTVKDPQWFEYRPE